MAQNGSESILESISDSGSENFSNRAKNNEKVAENAELISKYSAKETIQIMTTNFSENSQIDDRKLPKFNHTQKPKIAFQDGEADAILYSFSEIARQNILNLYMIWTLLRDE